MEDGTVRVRDTARNYSEVHISELSFRPSVYGIVIQDHKILLTRYKDGYDFPGGGVDIGERLLDACKREILEETGVTVDVGDIVHAQDDFFTHPLTKKHHQSILLYYRCTNPRGEVSTDMFDESDHQLGTLKAEWLPIEEAYAATFCNSVDSPALIRKTVETL